MKNKQAKHFTPDEKAIYFLPLGGCGFFGANLSLYGHDGKWLMVDCGMGFADKNEMPGVEVLLPDPTFIEKNAQNLVGLVVTHGHEDHIGAIEYLWGKFRCPIYTSAFTAELIRVKLSEYDWGHKVPINVIDIGASLDLEPFHIQCIRMAHSIPEMQALAISVKGVGTVLHTGDWKLDPDPLVGHKTDEAALKQLGDKGVLALIGDSTNAMVPGHSGSEATVKTNLFELFSEFKGRIAVTCFASNVARVKSIAEAAKQNGRHVALVGRSLWKVEGIARELGYLKGVAHFLDDEEAVTLPRHKVVFICTGSQGEDRAALAKIANDSHPVVFLEETDVVVFSSRTIPGNEKAIDGIKNRLWGSGVEVLTDRDAPVHVSGHPYRDELKQLIGWIKPQMVIPVHGEQMQLDKHAQLALECGVSQVLIPANGKVIRISPDSAPEFAGEVQSGVLAIEGKRMVAVGHEAILMRKRIMSQGTVVVTVVVDMNGELVSEPKVTAMGLLDEKDEGDQGYIDNAVMAICRRMESMAKAELRDDETLSEAIRITTRKYFEAQFHRKPQTRVHLVRI